MECLQRAIKNPLGFTTTRTSRGKDRDGKASAEKQECRCTIPQKGWRLRTTRPAKNTRTANRQNDDSATLQCYHADEYECSLGHTDPIPNPHFLKQQSKVHVGVLRKKELDSSAGNNQSYAYMSNHVIVNRERKLHHRPPLTRCAILDDMARSKAQEMAAQSRLLKPFCSETMVENVERGPSLQIIHQLQMHGLADNPQRAHILSERFVKFGMGTARGNDGNIYLSQLFQGAAVVHKKKEPPSLRPLVVDPMDNSTTIEAMDDDETERYSNQQPPLRRTSTVTPPCPIVRNIKSRRVPDIDKYIPDSLVRQQSRVKQSSKHQRSTHTGTSSRSARNR